MIFFQLLNKQNLVHNIFVTALIESSGLWLLGLLTVLLEYTYPNVKNHSMMPDPYWSEPVTRMLEQGCQTSHWH